MTSAPVTAIEPSDGGPSTVHLADGRRCAADHVLANCAPAVLDRLLGEPVARSGGQPAQDQHACCADCPGSRSGLDPEIGFAGTLHLARATPGCSRRTRSAGGRADPRPAALRGLLPHPHRPVDPGPELRARGLPHADPVRSAHPGRPVPGRSRPDPGRRRCRRALRSLQDALAEPLEDCLAVDATGRPCVEVMTPLDVEAEVGMPGGHIFHGDLDWPWLPDDDRAGEPGRALGRGDRAPGHPAVRLRCPARWRGQRAGRPQRRHGGARSRLSASKSDFRCCAGRLLVLLLARR